MQFRWGMRKSRRDPRPLVPPRQHHRNRPRPRQRRHHHRPLPPRATPRRRQRDPPPRRSPPPRPRTTRRPPTPGPTPPPNSAITKSKANAPPPAATSTSACHSDCHRRRRRTRRPPLFEEGRAIGGCAVPAPPGPSKGSHALCPPRDDLRLVSGATAISDAQNPAAPLPGENAGSTSHRYCGGLAQVWTHSLTPPNADPELEWRRALRLMTAPGRSMRPDESYMLHLYKAESVIYGHGTPGRSLRPTDRVG